MPRWFITFIVAFTLFGYGFSAVGQSFARVIDNPGHAVAHLLQEPHHHHDDGSLHSDTSQESAKHLNADDGIGSTAILTKTVELAVAVFPRTAPPGLWLHPPNTPFLEGLRRPPRRSETI